MAASIEDVARLAGVSIATVSRALRGLPDVANSTRDRVLDAAAELDYVASPFAARLASGRTATVGVVVPFVNRWFFAEVIDTVETSLRKAGLRPAALQPRRRGRPGAVLRRHADAQARRRRARRQPGARPTTRSPRSARSAARSACSGSPSPACSPRASTTSPRRGRRSTHLTGLGHRRIGLIGGDTDDPMRFTPPLHRADGYREALAEVGVGARPRARGARLLHRQPAASRPATR